MDLKAVIALPCIDYGKFHQFFPGPQAIFLRNVL